MNAEARLFLGLGPALIVTCAALAQTAPTVSEAPTAAAVQRAGSVEYLNGGAGERRARRHDGAAQRLRCASSSASRAAPMPVVDHVDVSQGTARVLEVDKAGPILMLKLAPGDYAVDARYAGQTERRQVRVGRDGTQLDWRLPDEPRH